MNGRKRRRSQGEARWPATTSDQVAERTAKRQRRLKEERSRAPDYEQLGTSGNGSVGLTGQRRRRRRSKRGESKSKSRENDVVADAPFLWHAVRHDVLQSVFPSCQTLHQFLLRFQKELLSTAHRLFLLPKDPPAYHQLLTRLVVCLTSIFTHELEKCSLCSPVP